MLDTGPFIFRCHAGVGNIYSHWEKYRFIRNSWMTEMVWYTVIHDDVIKWKHFPRYWPFVRGIHRGPVNSPHKWPVTRNFDVFLNLRLNKRLSKQSWGWWFETLSRPLWRHCNDHYTQRVAFSRCDGATAWNSFPRHRWIPPTKGRQCMVLCSLWR